MRRIVVTALAAGAALSMIGAASAQELVRPGWTPSGSAVCPSNYVYVQGWCRPLHGGGAGRHRYGNGYGYQGPAPAYGAYGYDRPRYGGAGYGHTVPPRWNHLGSAVCPSNYVYAAGVNACVALH